MSEAERAAIDTLVQSNQSPTDARANEPRDDHTHDQDDNRGDF